MRRRTAFVLGANGPQELRGLSQLRFAESDARRFTEIISATDFQFNVVSAGSTVSNAIIVHQFEGLACDLGINDELLFYFAGHGIVRHARLFLALNETVATRLAGTALPWDSIKHIIRECRANSKGVILDCCHAGEAVDDPLGGFRGGLDADVMNAAVRGSTAWILAACGPDGFAREDEKLGGGMLTALIARALGPERPAAADETGRLSLKNVRDWMWKEIDRSEDFASIRSDKPRLFTSGGPTIYLNYLDVRKRARNRRRNVNLLHAGNVDVLGGESITGTKVAAVPHTHTWPATSPLSPS